MIRGAHHLAGLDARFRPYVDEALQWMDYFGLEPIVTEGFRSVARQNELYAQGRTRPGQIVTKARGGQSAHNYGLAVDVTVAKGYSSQEQRWVQEVFKALGFGTITWDLPHGEHPRWRDLAGTRRA